LHTECRSGQLSTWGKRWWYSCTRVMHIKYEPHRLDAIYRLLAAAHDASRLRRERSGAIYDNFILILIASALLILLHHSGAPARRFDGIYNLTNVLSTTPAASTNSHFILTANAHTPASPRVRHPSHRAKAAVALKSKEQQQERVRLRPHKLTVQTTPLRLWSVQGKARHDHGITTRIQHEQRPQKQAPRLLSSASSSINPSDLTNQPKVDCCGACLHPWPVRYPLY
jgi:hypothetical protein